MKELTRTQKRECPFPGCDWSDQYDPGDYADELASEEMAESHYERKHAGRARVRVTLERTVMIGDESLGKIADRHHDKVVEEVDDEALYGWEVSYAVAEEVEPASDHSVLEDP